MNKILIYSQLAWIGLFAWLLRTSEPNPTAQISICHTGHAEMIAFLDDPEFVALHPSPRPIDFVGLGKMVSFPAPDGKKASGYLLEATDPSDDWLFVFQEWWGLNDNIREESERFYKDLQGKVNVIALDMYDGKVTDNPQEAGGFMRATEESRLENIVLAAQTYVGPEAKVANVGWCFGGSWSLKSALLLGPQNVGSVIYYGMPVRDVEQLKTLQSDVLGLFATEQNISKAVIEEFAEAMNQAGKELNYKIFDAVHGFANPSNARHDQEATQEAYAMALTYLQGKFD